MTKNKSGETIISNNDLYIGLGELIEKLCIVALKMWHLEERFKEVESMEERGEIATNLRNLNRERIALKNALNSIAGQGYYEIKVNHLSEAKIEQQGNSNG